MPDLDAAAVVRVLNRHGVKYVVIGGIAAQLHDLPVPATVDIDVTPARDHKNLERLAGAFEELEAGLYTAEDAGVHKMCTGRRGCMDVAAALTFVYQRRRRAGSASLPGPAGP